MTTPAFARIPSAVVRGARAAVATIAIAAAFASAPSAFGQRLDLDPSPSAPTLPERNAASVLAAALAAEVDALTTRAKSAPDQAWRIEASLAWRRVAHEMLVRGSEPGAPRHDLVVAGFRLADARGEFDRAVDRVPPHGRAADRAREGLDRFTAAPSMLRATATPQLGPALERALASLDGMLEVAGVPGVRNPWPTLGAGQPSQAPAPWSERLREAASSPALPGEAATALRGIADQVAIAEAWSDLAPEVRALAEPLLAAPSIATRFDAAGWVPAPRREQWMARLAAAAADGAPADRREAAHRELAHLEALSHAVEATHALVRPSGDGPRGPIDPSRPLKALLPLAEPAADADEVESRIDRLEMIALLMRTMDEVRSREQRTVDRARRAMRRELARDALRAEDPVLRQVESLAAPDAHPTDPACASLLQSQRRRIRALDALDAVDRSLAEIESRLPGSAKSLSARWNAVLRSLSDTGKGETALRDAEAFAREWERVRELPAERSLRLGDPEVTALCAGRVPELLAALDRRREAWAAAWAEGDGAGARSQIEAIVDLFELVEDAAALARARANPRLIGRWGGWDDLGGVPGATDAMDARVALAVEALARDDDAALREALAIQAREAPVWRLRATLIRRLAEPLASLPDGLSGAIGRASKPPPPPAFLADRALDLLTLARCSREYLFAMVERDADRAERLHEYLRRLAEDLRRDIERRDLASRPADAP